MMIVRWLLRQASCLTETNRPLRHGKRQSIERSLGLFELAPARPSNEGRLPPLAPLRHAVAV
jgi:hypothetical protein